MNKKLIFVVGLFVVFSNGYTSKPAVPLRTWRSESERITERRRLENLKQKLNDFQSLTQKPLNNCLRSLVLPGLGQRSVNQATKGWIFSSTIVLSTITAGGLYFYSNNIYDKYKAADNIEDIKKYYDQSNRFYLWSQYAMGATLGIWALNVMDAYFSTKAFNNKLLRDLLGFDNQMGLGFTLSFSFQPRISVGLTQRF